MPERHTLSLSRALVAGGVGLLLGAVVVYARATQAHLPASDFALVHAAAQSWISGQNPYEIVGPGRAYDWDYLLLYPFTAVLVAIPFSILPQFWADGVFVALGTAGLAWVAWNRPWLWWVFGSASMHAVLATSQWAPLFTLVTAYPVLGFLLTAKPSIGAAVWVAYPSRSAIVGGAVFILISVALMPGWPRWWVSVLGIGTGHLTVPLTTWGGPLLLLAWLRWYQPEARLLGALACVPQMAVPYDSALLFLVPQTHLQGFLLALSSWGVFIGAVTGTALPSNTIVWCLYLPCLIMILKSNRRRRIDVSSTHGGHATSQRDLHIAAENLSGVGQRNGLPIQRTNVDAPEA